ncbi:MULTISPECIES: alpha-xylosidase [Microbacterium]|uniref:Alpha-xylosidase n=1 Tax=Microbacterium wangchenii TaxID=2541726 RepID=A0ABX5SXL8_9MICO|nr:MULTISPECIES: alpha-xylosidase [Microbacterium]MCK6067157.1 alpha-xylosidase [Microbacterium sp. EYE_512]QBR89887.1 alpha-xylosidase [Microbacterium wangchenii]TXK16516.1 alpha-xylosidase [Microbacterium wangchenii]
MKFTDGFWQLRPGVTALYSQEAYDIRETGTVDGTGIRVIAPTKVIERRGDTLNRPVLTVTLSSPLEGVVRVRIEHHSGAGRGLSFALPGTVAGAASFSIDDAGARLRTGSLEAHVTPGAPWSLSFRSDGRPLTASGHKSQGYITLTPDAQVDPGIVGNARTGSPAGRSRTFVHEQLDLGVGELVYGLGERFGPLVKNGQTVDIWNADGGTSSEQAYKNVPFYLSDRGYGVLVNDPGHVSFEVGSEAVERVQFSVPGEALEYFVIDGPTPKDVLSRYTELTGRAPVVPAWSYGLWLSTSFTTDYDEATVSSFLDEMAARELPLSVFHFDCFWMREFQWCDFEWDPRVFPDPDGMLQRLHERDLRVSVWINPYIGQASPLFAEAAEQGFLVQRADGSVWQWDLWQAGMGLVDFTNPGATRWYQDKLRALVAQGVDCFKTDFGERIPLDVVYADGSAPDRMHNLYTHLYNQAVYDVLVEARGEGEAVLFARSATAGGQTMPVHWGGDSTSTFASMAETLRGGLSLAMSGFAHWSHDIGGFEGTPDPAVFKRWTAFGLLGTHSRLHGSQSYRVPWQFDEEAVEVTRTFTHLKMRLMPYLYQAGLDATETGVPVMRPMALEFPHDPAAAYLDRQYMLGSDLLVAPVFSADGDVEFYLPEGEWTQLLIGETVTGGRWRRERHGFDSIPVYVRPGAVIPWGARTDRPDYDYLDGLRLRVFPGGEGIAEVRVTTPDGRSVLLTADRSEITR